MRLFDTHCHFETADRGVIAAQLERARNAGVERLVAVGGSAALNDSAALASAIAAADPVRFPRVLMARGLDRDQVGTDVGAFPEGPGDCAWGEIGLDYHYAPETREEQCALFAAQLEAARRRGLPVVIHTREADADTLALLREIPSRGVIHCFTGTPDFAAQLLALGFYISISGIVTFKAAEQVRASAMVVPDDRLLLETDSPFLAPVPMRGQPNEPAWVKYTCEFLARLRGTDPDSLAELTFANGARCFGMSYAREKVGGQW